MPVWVLSRFSYVWLFATPWTVVGQAPLSTGFSRQEYWSGYWVAIPSSRGSSQPRDRSRTAGWFYTAETPGKPKRWAVSVSKWQNKMTDRGRSLYLNRGWHWLLISHFPLLSLYIIHLFDEQASLTRLKAQQVFTNYIKRMIQRISSGHLGGAWGLTLLCTWIHLTFCGFHSL